MIEFTQANLAGLQDPTERSDAYADIGKFYQLLLKENSRAESCPESDIDEWRAEANKAFRQALELEPNNIYARNHFAFYLLERERIVDNAVSILRDWNIEDAKVTPTNHDLMRIMYGPHRGCHGSLAHHRSFRLMLLGCIALIEKDYERSKESFDLALNGSCGNIGTPDLLFLNIIGEGRAEIPNDLKSFIIESLAKYKGVDIKKVEEALG
jgi:tetratricopeptide (TPR) repeat protein